MSKPIEVALPHKLGKEEARRRIAGNIDKLERHIPGQATVRSAWVGDRLDLAIATMGQEVSAQIDVGDSAVQVRMLLPGMLGFFGGAIESALRAKGSDLLLEDKRD